MAFIVDERIEAYAEAHTTPPLDLLARLAQETKETLRSPQMLTGTIEGRFLELLVFGTGARRVLEIGTYSGYSALSMAAGLPPDGRIDTCEIEPKHAEVAQPLHRREPVCRPDHSSSRAGAGVDRGARRRLRLRLHRRRQGQLRELPRGGVAAAHRGRVDRDRQHALERQGARPAGRGLARDRGSERRDRRGRAARGRAADGPGRRHARRRGALLDGADPSERDSTLRRCAYWSPAARSATPAV